MWAFSIVSITSISFSSATHFNFINIMFTFSIYFKPTLSILSYSTRKKGKKRLPHPAPRSFHPISFVLWLILCFIGLHSIHLYSYKCTFRRLKPFRHFYHRLLWIHPGKRAPQYRKLNACLEAKRPAFPFILQNTIFTIFLKYFSNSCKLCYNGKNTWPKGRFAQYTWILHRR